MVSFSNKDRLERLEIYDRTHQLDTNNKEIVVILLSGSFETQGCLFYREGVFSENPQGFYVSNFGVCEIVVSDFAEICVIESESTKTIPFTMIENKNTTTIQSGKDSYCREVTTILDGTCELENLIVGETFKNGGSWSSWPPHKHDTNIPEKESKQKEIYLYKFKKPNGYGVQITYSENIKDANTYIVTDNDELKIENGYHPVVASPYSEMYYLWALFGDNSFFKVNYEEE
jgi:5-deoxy-glucuronate isomerase